MEFKVGDKVEHILSKDWMLVIRIFDNGSIICRTKSLDVIQFQPFELKKV